MQIRTTFAMVLICIFAAQRSEAAFSYYVLSLSYAPDFCAQPAGKKDPRECGTGRRVGFVVHGLWPQDEGSRGPENCGSVSPVAQDIVRSMLSYIPTESLIQHEWRTHGSCTGLNASDYFTFVRRARDMVRIPDDLKAPTRPLQFPSTAIEAKFADANPNFPRGAFRASCYRGTELQEIRISLNKDLSPRVYGSGGGSCGRTVLIRPVR
jgi:ribonuclease T2